MEEILRQLFEQKRVSSVCCNISYTHMTNAQVSELSSKMSDAVSDTLQNVLGPISLLFVPLLASCTKNILASLQHHYKFVWY